MGLNFNFKIQPQKKDTFVTPTGTTTMPGADFSAKIGMPTATVDEATRQKLLKQSGIKELSSWEAVEQYDKERLPKAISPLVIPFIPTPTVVRPAFAKKPVTKNLPPIVTVLGDFGSRMLELVPKVATELYLLGKENQGITTGKAVAPTKMPFDVRRLGYAEDKPLQSVAIRFYDKVDKLQKERPSGNPYGIGIQAMWEEVVPVALDFMIVGDMASAGAKSVLKFTKYDPQLEWAFSKLGMTQQEFAQEGGINLLKKKWFETGKNINISEDSLKLKEFRDVTSILDAKFKGTGIIGGNLNKFMQVVQNTARDMVVPIKNIGGFKASPLFDSGLGLPGTRPTPGQAPAFGLSIKKFEAVGQLTEQEVQAIVLKNIPKDITKISPDILKNTLIKEFVAKGVVQQEAVTASDKIVNQVAPGLQPSVQETDILTQAKKVATESKSAEEFVNRMPTPIRDTLREQGIKGTEQLTKFYNDNVAKTEPILDSLNPTGSLFVDYNPQERATMKLGDNMTTLDKTSGKSPDEMVTIYRGAPKSQTEINPGDFVSTDYQSAKSYSEEGNVISKKVKLSDILDDKTEPLGGDYLYRPNSAPKIASDTQQEAEYQKAIMKEMGIAGGFDKAETEKLAKNIIAYGGLKKAEPYLGEMQDIPERLIKKDGLTPDQMLEALNQGKSEYNFESEYDVLEMASKVSGVIKETKYVSGLEKATRMAQRMSRWTRVAEKETAKKARELEREIKNLIKQGTVGRNVPTKQVINQQTGITKIDPETIAITQKQLLTKIESASKLGKKAGVREARDIILNKLRVTLTNQTDVKNQIVDFIKENIPTSERGRFLNLIKDSKSQNDLIKAFVRIEQRANEIIIKDGLNKLIKTVNKISDNNTISADYRNKIKDLVEDYELKGHNQSTIDKIKGLQDFIDRQASLGVEVELPQRMIDKLKILERTPKDQLTFEKIQTLQSEVELLAKLGETKWASKQALYDAEKNYRKQELLDAVSPINSREVRTIGFEKQPAKYLQTYFKWRNYLQKTKVGLTPIEGLADITGMTPMKNVMDLNFGNYLSYNDNIVKQWYDLTKDFDETNFKRIGAYSISQQTGGAERLIANNNMTQEMIDNLELTPEEKKAYNFARDTFDSEFPAVKKYALDNYNKDVGEVKNYVSFMSDNDALNELEMYDRFGTGPENTRNTKTVEQGFTEKRAKMAENPLELNIDKIFRRHTDDVAYMLTTGRDIKQYFEIVNSPEMRVKLGDVGATAWLQYLDLMARKGGSEGAKRIAPLDTLRKNLAVGVLAFRISSALVQFTSFADTLGTIGTEWGMKGASSIATSREWRDFIMDNFPEVRKAIGDDIAFREFGDGFISKVAQKGLKPLEMLDGLMRSTAAAGGYAKEMASRGLEIDFKNPNKDAIQVATKMMRQSQGSSFFKDQPLSLTTNYGLTDNKSLNKTILTFQSFMLARWDNMWRQMWRMGIKEKNYSKAFMSFFWMVIFATTLEESIRRGVKFGVGKITEFITGNEDKTNYGSFVKNSAMNLVQSVPIMGQLISSMEYSSNPIPTVKTFDDVLSGANSVWNGKSLQTKIKGGVTTAGALGSVLGIPGSSQVSQIIKGFIPPVNSGGSSTGGSSLKFNFGGANKKLAQPLKFNFK